MLAEMKARLEQRFSGLAAARAASDFPVYAIEHGLSGEELTVLRRNLRQELSTNYQIASDNWLSWCVCATEQGYGYDGGEYWPPFNETFPEWGLYVANRRMQHFFAQFRKSFRGFVPRGGWAGQFRNIAGPIFHSILPQYLQTRFIGHLHGLRYELPRHAEAGVEALGAFLLERYWGGPTRFEQFLQQTTLTARLVFALRDEDVAEGVAPIEREVLQRIVRDLEQYSTARSMFRDTRRMLRDARVVASSSLGGKPGDRAAPEPAPAAAPTQRARLVARREGSGAWGLSIALADIAGALRNARVSLASLDSVGVKLFGAGGGFRPGRLLNSLGANYEIAVAAMPGPNDTLLAFDQDRGDITLAIGDRTRLDTQSPWLLRLHQDGAARQVLGNHVRARSEYVLVVRDEIAASIRQTLGLEAADVVTTGVHIYTLSVPAILSEAYQKALANVGLGYALRVRAEPVGLAPRWDAASGTTQWLPDEAILMRLSSDLLLVEYVVSCENGVTVRVPTTDTAPVLIALGDLRIGRHRIEIGARLKDATRRLEPETIFLEVRAPAPWSESVRAVSGVRAMVEPLNASLRDLTEHKARFCVLGPPQRSVAVEAVLFNAAGHPTGVHSLGALKLPSSDEDARKLIERLSKVDLAEAVQTAPRVDLRASVGELGADAVTFYQKTAPIRWGVARNGAKTQVRLIDETGGDLAAAADAYSIHRPDERRGLDVAVIGEGETVDAPGALYVARLDKRAYATLVCVAGSAHYASLADMDVPVSLTTRVEDHRALWRLMSLYRAWRRADPLGPLAPTRRWKVLCAFEDHFAASLCGRSWADFLARAIGGDVSVLAGLQQRVGGSAGFASQMRSKAELWRQADAAAVAEFTRLAHQYRLVTDREDLCRVAFAFAFDPGAVRLGEAVAAGPLLDDLVVDRILVRGAHLARVSATLWPRGQISQAGTS